ncbi:MAG: signal recognition particle-docking protein FtsY [Rickettsiales bacterium]|jgi:fused signal recognition particle receptor|nr:signal recognition particle-docking protein FtsY [Rickettsiales bacterium]
MSLFAKIFGRDKPGRLSIEQLEEILIAGDVSPGAAQKIASKVRAKNPENFDSLVAALRGEIANIIRPLEKKFEPAPHEVIMIAGVNGAGKTTTIGKLANLWRDKKIEIGACDTFRAAATEQLSAFAEKTGAGFTCGSNSDPASVAFQAVQKNADITIIDTAGRLGTRSDLMDELPKIVRVVKKINPDAPHEIWLVLDGTTGQNIMSQIKAFGEKVPLTGLIITKLDGSARAGALISYAVAEARPLPVVFTTNGEKISDIAPLSAEAFAARLTDI